MAGCLQVGGLHQGRHRAMRRLGEAASMAQDLGTSSLGPLAGGMQGPRWAIKVRMQALSLLHGPLHLSAELCS